MPMATRAKAHPFFAPHSTPSSTQASHPSLRTWSLLLDGIFNQLLQARRQPMRVEVIIKSLFGALSAIRCDCNRADWKVFCSLAQRHPLAALLQEDPFTRRSVEKPRGYAGDAPLLDFVYAHPPTLKEAEPLSPLGKAIMLETTRSTVALAVDRRRHRLADAIQRACDKTQASLLSVACGHLREIELLGADSCASWQRFVAYDHDLESLATITRDYGHLGIECHEGNVAAFLRAGSSSPVEGSFDLIYVSGLYDYLSDRLAKTLTQSLFDRLAPKGRLLITNLAPDTLEAGYMDAFMEWKLIYRSKKELHAIATSVTERAITTLDENGRVAHSVLERN